MKILDLIREDAVKDLEKDLKNPLGYDAIDHMMKSIAKKYNITPKKLHDLFVEKNNQIPDDWVKKSGKTIE
jgi:ABC-type proline/glycine betaine transport system substrate-binding protein